MLVVKKCSWFCTLLAVVVCALPAFAQVQPKLVGRPPDFSGAVGAYSIRHSATPTEVYVEDPIVVTVAITGTASKGQEPKRALLKLFPEGIEDDFFIEDVPEQDRYLTVKNTWLTVKNTWEFVYRLRPKHLDVKLAPALKFVYYDPNSKSFQPAWTSAEIPLVVKPRTPAAVPVPETLVIPPGFEKLYSTPDDLRPWTPHFWTTAPGMIAAFGLPLLACGLWFWFWKRANPDAVAVVRRRHSLAARKALHALRSLQSGIDGERLAGVLAVYAHERLDLPAREPTADELAQALRKRRVSAKVILQARAVFQDIDAARFDRPARRLEGANPLQLAALIGNVEEALCRS